MRAAAGVALLVLAGACASRPSHMREEPVDPLDQVDPDRAPSAATLHAVARLLAVQGRDEECEAALERLIAAYPDFAPAYNDLAELHLRYGRFPEAEAALDLGLERSVRDAVLLNNLGMCRLLRGDCEGALESFTSASAAVPHDARSRANMALALGLLGRDQEAEALYLQVLPPEQARHNLDLIAALRSDPGRAAAAVGAPPPVQAEAPAER